MHFLQPPFYSRDTAEMYDNILYKPLRLRTNVTAAGRSILEGVSYQLKDYFVYSSFYPLFWIVIDHIIYYFILLHLFIGYTIKCTN